MKITEFLFKSKIHDYPSNSLLTISSNNGMTFLTFSFFNIFDIFTSEKKSYYSGNFLELSFMVDIVIPGYEFTFCFLGFQIFFRHNKKSAQAVFEDFNKQVEEIRNGRE